MDKIEAAPLIDFSDSEFKTFELTDEDVLIIYLESWEERRLKIMFIDVVGFIYQTGNLVSNLYVTREENLFFEESLSRAYTKKPESHPYKLFYLENISNYPFIQVVAKHVEVIKV